MDQIKREYDRFGPWILEISEADPPPPLFEPHLTRSELPLLGIKIPRPIERRAAHPGMDLYDYLVCLYEEDGLILQRVGSEVRSTTFGYRDVLHLRMSAELLLGEVRLGLPGQTCRLPFNAVSSEPMARLVDLIRQRYGRDQGRPSDPGPGPRPSGLGYYFERLLETESAADPDMRLLAAQTETQVESHETGFMRRILYGLVSKRLLESLHLSDGSELKIVSRVNPYALGWQRVYGSATWYVPTANLIDVSWRNNDRNAAVIDCTLVTRDGEHPFVFSRDNPFIEAYAEYLSSLLVRGPSTEVGRGADSATLGASP